MATPQMTHQTSAAAIFGRLWSSALSRPVARHLLTLGFDAEDKDRMHALAERCRDGRLTAAERAEYDAFIRVGELLAVLHSKARMRLDRDGAVRDRTRPSRK